VTAEAPADDNLVSLYYALLYRQAQLAK